MPQRTAVRQAKRQKGLPQQGALFAAPPSRHPSAQAPPPQEGNTACVSCGDLYFHPEGRAWWVLCAVCHHKQRVAVGLELAHEERLLGVQG